MAHGDMNRNVELAWLLDFYGGLLTEKQRQILSMHCEEDLSLAEISDVMGISRQGVHEHLTRTSQRLMDLEEKLGMAARFRRMQDGLQQCLLALQTKQYDQAETLLKQLVRLQQEESNGL